MEKYNYQPSLQITTKVKNISTKVMNISNKMMNICSKVMNICSSIYLGNSIISEASWSYQWDDRTK